LLAGIVGVTWLLLPDLAGVVTLCCGIYWAWKNWPGLEILIQRI
jgi:hypothetical protein